MITAVGHVYEFVDRVIVEARKHGRSDIAGRLGDEMRLGSSSLEILGAIKIALSQDASAIDSWLERSEREEVIRFVNRAYGST